MSKQVKKRVCRPEEKYPRFRRWGRHDLLVVACSTWHPTTRTCVCTTRSLRLDEERSDLTISGLVDFLFEDEGEKKNLPAFKPSTVSIKYIV